jgi:hypothetical protein
MQNKKTTLFLSSQGIVFDILNKRSNTLIVSHAFMPRKFIEVEKEPLTKLGDECRHSVSY